MFVEYRGSIVGIVRWQWKYFLLFLCVSSGAVLIENYLPLWVVDMTELPSLPLAVVGGAIGIFVSFRTNSAYDRWWEGRKLWGRLINSSRHWSSQVLMYLPGGDGIDGAEPDELQTRLVRRQIAYVHILRCLLRLEDPWKDQDVLRFTPEDELESYEGRSNITHAILLRQLADLRDQNATGQLDDFRLQSFDRTLMDFLNIQGGCERIKKTPFPRSYGYIAERMILAYGVLLPFGLVDEMGWATVPMTVLVCMGFLLISEVGRVMEDPFTLFWPALPLFALSKTIELNLRDALGERDLPAGPKPGKNGVLM